MPVLCHHPVCLNSSYEAAGSFNVIVFYSKFGTGIIVLLLHAISALAISLTTGQYFGTFVIYVRRETCHQPFVSFFLFNLFLRFRKPFSVEGMKRI